jgi:hypothetical protein
LWQISNIPALSLISGGYSIFTIQESERKQLIALQSPRRAPPNWLMATEAPGSKTSTITSPNYLLISSSFFRLGMLVKLVNAAANLLLLLIAELPIPKRI